MVTTLAGIAVDQQFIVFGASGAVLVTAIIGLLLNRLLPVAQSTQQHFPRPRQRSHRRC
jgi:hypothetical protein